MGAETLRLLNQANAEVHAIDVAPVDTEHWYQCDLGDPDAIDATVAKLPAPLNAIMNCAGVPNGGRFTAEEVMRVNWFGLRHLTESLLPRVTETGAVVNIASTAGRNWSGRPKLHEKLMAARTFDAGLAWLASNREVTGDGYVISKEAVQYYTLWRSVQLLPTGVRMNSVCPGITATGILEDFRKGMGDDIVDHAEAVAGRAARPAEMAPAMLFLADHQASSYLNGVNLNIDRGTGAARATNQSDPSAIWSEPTGS